MATIHRTSGTPGLLSDLGQRFLERVYYAGLLEDVESGADVLELEHSVIGFVSYSRDSASMFRSVILRRARLSAICIARAAARKPRVLRDLLETILATSRNSLARDVKSEIVSLEIASGHQGLGLGFTLLKRAVDLLVDEGRPIKARILTDNSAVERLYQALQFRSVGAFRLHGRAWTMLVRRP
jgi:GNAT superfamily N-acetyltransferase